jgi:hypothetical protein
MGNASKTYTGPNGGKQKLSVKARKDKQARDKTTAMSPLRKHAKKTAQVFRRNIKNIDMLNGKDVHHSSDGSMRLVSVNKNRGHHVT